MKKVISLFIFYLSLVGIMSAQVMPARFSNVAGEKVRKPIQKSHFVPPAWYSVLQGGETIETATVLPGQLPLDISGTTEGYIDDYNETCYILGSGAPDVVYSYTPLSDITVDIDLCGSSYDTKVYVYENVYTPGSPFDCNDDYYFDDFPCGTYVSIIQGLALTGGNTYYIVVDGYGVGFEGPYLLSIREYVECVWGVDISCPESAGWEGEVCGNDNNGGCNMIPGSESWVYVPPAGQAYCGTLWALGGSRDTDWYELNLEEASHVVVTADAEQMIVFGLLSGGTAGYYGDPDCSTITGIDPYIYAGPCLESSLDLGTFYPGTYWFSVSLTVFEGNPCEKNYWIDFQVTPVSCPSPLFLSTTDVTASSAIANFDIPPIPPDSFFDVFYGLEGSFPPDEGTLLSGITNPPATLTELLPGTTYDWYVRSVCFDNPKVDHFWISIDELGIIDETASGGAPVDDPGEDGLFYLYTPSGQNWYNVWFYDHPYDATRMKIIRMGFYVQPVNQDMPANLYYVINWSTPEWQGPGFPKPSDEAYIMRSPVNGPVQVLPPDSDHPYGQWIELSYVIADYNPEWVSVDIWGDNIMIPFQSIAPPSDSPLYSWWGAYPYEGGIIIHDCLPKPTGSDWSGPETFTTISSNPSNCGLNQPIPDEGCSSGIYLDFPLEVAEAPDAQLGIGLAFSSISMIIQHPNDGDLDIFLLSPDGVEVELSTGNGADGDNYGEPANCPEDATTFSMVATIPVTAGAAPYIGAYIPEGDLDWFNDGSSPNGTWYLRVCDNAGGNIGALEYVAIEFVELPSCPAPENVQVGNINPTTAEVSWTMPGYMPPDSFFDVFYGIEGSLPPDEGTIVTGITSPPYTMTELVPDSFFDVFVRLECGFDSPKLDHFYIAIDDNYAIDEGLSGGFPVDDPGEDGLFFFYTPTGQNWYNTWFYDHPLDLTRMKIIRMGFWVQRWDPALTANLYYVINWSTQDWAGPGFPTPADELFIMRSPTNGPLPVIAADPDHPYGQWVEIYYVIPDYNPEWVSVDIWGDNIIVLSQLIPPPEDSPLLSWWLQDPQPGGIIVHECVPKPSGSTSDWIGPVSFQTLPLCPPPSGLTATNITSSSADLGWTPVGSELNWNVEVGPPGFIPGDGTSSLVGYGVNTFPWTAGPLSQGTDFEFWVQADCGFSGTTSTKVDNFWLSVDEFGFIQPFPLSGGLSQVADPGEDLIWRQYDQQPGFPWYNIWFFNDTVDTTHYKKIRMGFWVLPFNEAAPGELYYVVNWSTPGWDPAVPGYPMPSDEAYIERSPVNGPVLIDPIPLAQWIELYYIIPDYNPEWVSVDIWGTNILIENYPLEPPITSQLWPYWYPEMPGGIIVHECLPKTGDQSSSWSGPQPFATPCDNGALPYDEFFDINGWPICWSQGFAPSVTSNRWSLSATSNAGGSENEMKADFEDASGESWLTSPVVDIPTGGAMLRFKHFFADAGPGLDLSVRYSTDGGSSWIPLWTISSGIGDQGPETIQLPVNASGNLNFQWYLNGDHVQMNGWYLDDVSLHAMCTWTGAVSDVWSEQGNWSCGLVPDAQKSVVIPTLAGGTPYPFIGSGIVGECYEVFLEPGATITVQNGGFLNVMNP